LVTYKIKDEQKIEKKLIGTDLEIEEILFNELLKLQSNEIS